MRSTRSSAPVSPKLPGTGRGSAEKIIPVDACINKIFCPYISFFELYIKVKKGLKSMI